MSQTACQLHAAILVKVLWPAVFVIFLLSTAALAAPDIVPVEGMSFNVQASMVDNLKGLEGKLVNITLRSGGVFSGKITGVGDHLLHLELLENKGFFDALIRVEDISAIDARFRQPKR